MIERRKVPWTLWVYALMMVASIVPFLFLVHDPPPAVVVGTIAITLAWAFFLLRGVRWLWIFTLILNGLGLLQTLIFGPRVWWSFLLSLIIFGLLLAPSTRRHFAKPERQPRPATL